MRIGSDYTDNYYEYEIPLKMSDLTILNSVKNDLLVYSEGVWLADNAFDFPLHLFTDLKEERNKVDGVGTYYSKNDPENPTIPSPSKEIPTWVTSRAL
jgi:cell surface protein SprA